MKKLLLFSLLPIFIVMNKGFAQTCPVTHTCYISPVGATTGTAVAYFNPSGTNLMDSVTLVVVSSSPFTITVPDTGVYIFKYTPAIGTGYQTCYADTALSWQTATSFTNNCSGGTYVNFLCSPFASIGTGSGSIAGQIVQGIGYGQKPSGVQAPGNPIGGIVVKGGKNPGAQLFAQTTTDANGQYSFNNLPDGSYFIVVDIPGLDTTATHHVDITSGSSFSNLGFVAGSNGITPSTSVGIKETKKTNYAYTVFPNPAKNQFSVEFMVNQPSEISIQVVDMIGKYAKELYHETNYKGKFSSTFNLNLKPGNYLVKTTINGEELISKLIITQ